MGTLAGKTYEVQVDQGDGRWVVVDIHETRNSSIEQARALLESGRYAGSRVIAESDRSGLETVFEEVFEGFNGKPITIVPINKAPLCTAFDDFFAFEPRRTIARVLRNYLEHHTLSALELMYDASHIRMLENSDTLFPQAVQQIAGAQARSTNTKPSERADELYTVVSKIRDKATATAGDNSGYETLKDKGIDALIKRMDESHGVTKAPYFIRHAFALYLRDGGDWNAKLGLLSKLGVDGLSNEATVYLDEIMAEILDGAPAVKELLGGQPDQATAARVLVLLTLGRAVPPQNSLSCLADVNVIMPRLDLALTKGVLLERVASQLGGTRKLTREGGGEDERRAFTMILRDLTDVAGILGGPDMCSAVIRRGRLSFSQGGEDLTFPDAMTRVINLLPRHAARIGFLADLSRSPSAEDHKALVLSELSKNINQQTSLESLAPPGSSNDAVRDVIEGLKQRLSPADIPQKLRDALYKTLDQSTPGPAPSAAAKTPAREVIVPDEKFKAMLNEKPKHREVPKGETLFEEGDLGQEAYLIMDGEIEVFQRVGNTEHVIATLKKGEIIGEMSLIDNQPRIASARVVNNASLLIVSQKNLQMRLDRLQQEDRFTRRLMDTLVSRLRGEAHSGA